MKQWCLQDIVQDIVQDRGLEANVRTAHLSVCASDEPHPRRSAVRASRRKDAPLRSDSCTQLAVAMRTHPHEHQSVAAMTPAGHTHCTSSKINQVGGPGR
ncbi:unnamed protein product [Pleuronectes platessa]|uniref:Uncharacterized protein n=1 Tax=Pleuronectes platessa TaxID=8262 RepID=A0A9N7YZP5_PLEPL|nr:unnamed protein product [Pleuronectes platessa]